MESPLHFAIMSPVFVYDLTNTTAVLVYRKEVFHYSHAKNMCSEHADGKGALSACAQRFLNTFCLTLLYLYVRELMFSAPSEAWSLLTSRNAPSSLLASESDGTAPRFLSQDYSLGLCVCVCVCVCVFLAFK
jgi:hypothetical protein